MSKDRVGANGVRPRVPAFPDSPPRPAGVPRGDHIVLDEEDERILDKVWAEVIGPPSAHVQADGQAAPSGSTYRENGAVARAARRSRKPAPTSS